MPKQTPTRACLRRELRARRRALSDAERRQAAQRFGRHLRRDLGLLRVRHVAVYLACDGELDPLPALTQGRFRRALLYLPVLDPVYRGRLRFHRWPRDQRLRRNRFGIGEPPRSGRARASWALDAILMPLVGFDDAGHRLGMGGGFYDRTLSELARRPRRPRLIGVAHEFQRVAHLPTAWWDQPVDQVITG